MRREEGNANRKYRKTQKLVFWIIRDDFPTVFNISIIVLTLTNDDNGGFLSLKTTLPTLPYVWKRRYRCFLTFESRRYLLTFHKRQYRISIAMKKWRYRVFFMFNNEQKRRYRRKNRKGFRRFWLEKNDNTDGFLRFLTDDFSTRELFLLL